MFWLGRQRFSNNSASRSTGTRPELCTWPMGSSFWGFKIKRGKRQFKLSHDRIKSKLTRQGLYAIPTQKSVDRFKDQIRALTKRRVPLRMGELIKAINPIVRGWGNYFCRSHVRTLFHQLDGWIVRRLWSHHAKRWRNTGWEHYPTKWVSPSLPRC